MQVYTELLPERKSSRRGVVRFTRAEGDYSPVCGTLVVQTERSHAEYLVTEFPVGWDGRGFQLDKLTAGSDKEAEGYACFLARNGQDRSCECRGFLVHGHCKHLDSLVTLVENLVL